MRYMLGPLLPYVYIGHPLFFIVDVMLFTIENKTYFNQLAQPFYEAESQATYADN